MVKSTVYFYSAELVFILIISISFLFSDKIYVDPLPNVIHLVSSYMFVYANSIRLSKCGHFIEPLSKISIHINRTLMRKPPHEKLGSFHAKQR